MPALEELPTIEPTERLQILPSWCDSRFQLAQFQTSITPVVLSPGVLQKIAFNDPNRWAIGFQDNFSASINVRVGIDPNVANFGHPVNTNLKDSWFTIFNYGPMICMEWYAFSLGGGTFYMYENGLQ